MKNCCQDAKKGAFKTPKMSQKPLFMRITGLEPVYYTHEKQRIY